MALVAKIELGPDDVRALRGDLSRADFARKVGVTPLTVYRWELPDGAAESRRPRGAVAERLRRVVGHGTASEKPSSIAPPRMEANAVSTEEATAVLPALDRILRAEFSRADDDLMQLLVSGALTSASGRAMGQAALSICQFLARHDGRAAFMTLQPALRDADAGALPPDAELLVRVAASIVFSAPDGKLFDVGRVNAQVARGNQLVTPDTSPDVVFILRLGGALAALYGRGVGPEASRAAREALLEIADRVTEPVTRLVADEMKVHFAVLSGGSTSVTEKFRECAERAAKLGVPFVEARALAFLALRYTDEIVAPQEILDMARRSKAVASRARLGPGLHAVFAAKAAGEALLRLARFDDAERELEDGVDAAHRMAWAPIPLVTPFVRLFEYTNRRDRIAALAAQLRQIPKGSPPFIAEALDAAEAALAGDKSDRLSKAEHALEKTGVSPYLLQELLLQGVGARLPHGDVPDIKLALRRAQRMLDRFPSATLSALEKRLEGLLACRQGRLAEALPLLEASVATFTLAGDLPEAALGRHWLARVKYELEEAGAEDLVAASEKECEEMGLVPHPAELPFGTFDPDAPSSAATLGARSMPRAEGISSALERLSVRGLSPAMMRRELAKVTSELFGGRLAVVEEIGSKGEQRVVAESGARGEAPEEWFEFGDGLGGRLRLGLGGALPDGAYGVLRVITMIASLSFEVASLRGVADAATSEPSDDGAPEVPGLVAASASMRRLRSEIARLGSARATVILQGESGTGKEVVARAIHDLSARKQGPYVTFNCAAVPRELFEGQLFGYRRGAFTGAHADHAGVISSANGGTLFLDEIGELPLELQPKLLRFLENGEIHPLGEARAIQVDVRVIAATHQDLARRVREGKFREDLYYRLQVVPLTIPPLRERPEDVAALARWFVKTLAPKGAEPPAIAPDALAQLASHSWPGNVRELRNVVERALAFAPLPRVLSASHLRIR